jgi:hypothetical protein
MEPSLNLNENEDLVQSSKPKSFKSGIEFSDLLSKIKSQYESNHFEKARHNFATTPKIKITERDYARLSKFEKGTIRAIANIYKILNDPNGDVTFSDFKNIMAHLSKFKSDAEKDYLIGLFFPERIKNIHSLNPFPIPTHVFVFN